MPSSPVIDPSLKAKIEAWRLTDPRNDFLNDEQCLKWMEKEEREKDKEKKKEKKKKRSKAKRSTNTFSLLVNYDLPLTEAIQAGNYDRVNPDITKKKFPPAQTGTKKVRARLFHFDRRMSSEQAIQEMDKAGYDPADLRVLLKLSETHPDLQREFPIVALGSVYWDWYGNRNVAFLLGDGARRDLGLHWFGDVWDEYWRFLAVHKGS